MGSQAQGYESPFLCNGALPKLKFGVDGGGIDTNLNFSQKGSQWPLLAALVKMPGAELTGFPHLLTFTS